MFLLLCRQRKQQILHVISWLLVLVVPAFLQLQRLLQRAKVL